MDVAPHFIVLVEEWDSAMALNLRSVMLCYKYAAIQMIKQGQGGRIIGANLARQARVKVRKIFTKSAHVRPLLFWGRKV